MNKVPLPKEFGSRREWEARVWRTIIEGIARASSAKEVELLLGSLITAHEKKQMVKRVAAMSFLAQKKSYREIGRILWLSPQTVSAIRKSMLDGEDYKSRYARTKKEKRR